eukprot:gene24943-biopygen16465
MRIEAEVASGVTVSALETSHKRRAVPQCALSIGPAFVTTQIDTIDALHLGADSNKGCCGGNAYGGLTSESF